MPKLSGAQWLALEADWRTGAYSNRELAERYGVTEAAIRKRAKVDGWTRNLSDVVERRAERKVIESTQGGSQPPESGFAKAIPGTQAFAMIEEAVVEALADRRATENLAALTRTDDLKRLRNRYLEIVEDCMSGDEVRSQASAPILLMGRGDSLSGAIKAIASIDESIQKQIRTALGMEQDGRRNKVEVSGPGGGPVKTEASVDFSKLPTKHLEALAALNAMLDADGEDKGPPLPPE